jgi:hypothetical protein
MSTPARLNPETALLPLGLVSMAVLALEVLLTRILSYSVNTGLLYVVLGIALLGFGAAGSAVAVRPNWLKAKSVDRILVWAALTAALAFVACPALFVRVTPYLYEASQLAFLIAATLTIPFFAAALVITLALSYTGNAPGRAYASNLIGSGLGCFVPILLLGPIDGEQLLALLSLLIWIAALIYLFKAWKSASRISKLAVFITLPLILLALVAPNAVFRIQPEPAPEGQVSVIRKLCDLLGARMQKVYDRWNATGRIEVFAFRHVRGAPDPYPYMYYAQDSSAGSLLARWDGRDRDQVKTVTNRPGATVSHLCDEAIYSQAYYRERPRVLIIGLGGGPDLQCALYHRTRSVDVVEINPDSIDLVRGPFDEWLGGAGSDERVHFYNQDGRSFVHGARSNGYDLIQLTGVDTKQSLASGSLALNENNLYTREAFLDYLKNLTPDGVLSIIRFGEAEALRLANTALWALRRLGVADPTRNVSVLRSHIIYGVLVHRTGFTESDVDALRHHFANRPFSGISPFFYNTFFQIFQPAIPQYLPGTKKTNNFTSFFSKVANGEAESFITAYNANIRPATDDRPFFFDSNRYDRGISWTKARHITTLRDLVAAVVVLSLVLILFPVLWQRSRLRTRGATAVENRLSYPRARLPFFFASIGLGYLLVEVWMLNRFSIYLGHQTRALAVVLSAMLISSGFGAFWSERLSATYRIKALVSCGVVVMLLGLAMKLSLAFIEASWQVGPFTRVFLAILFVAPIGMAMGVPFVAGLTWVHNNFPAATPWCIGINGFASVLAAVVVIPLSLICGYSVVLVTGIALYVTAFIMAFGMHVKAGKASQYLTPPVAKNEMP